MRLVLPTPLYFLVDSHPYRVILPTPKPSHHWGLPSIEATLAATMAFPMMAAQPAILCTGGLIRYVCRS